MKTYIWTIIAASVLAGFCFGAVLNVPSQYPTIQSAIDAASDYDQIVLAEGVYTGTGNRNINFRGKKITLRSTDPTDWAIVKNTIINCGQASRAMTFYMAEDRDTIVEGITITNGNSTLGGAVYCYNNSSPIIRNCFLTNNRGILGGAVACANTDTAILITNCIITNNTALVSGGGVYCNGAKPQIRNSFITENTASEGAGVYLHNPSSMSILNCTISRNYASASAGAVYCHSDSSLSIVNSIIRANTAADNQQIRVGNSSDAASVKISYCNIENPDGIVRMVNCDIEYGQGNIAEDPLFVGLAGDIYDYHITEDSPCIDMGDPDFKKLSGETDIDGETRVSGKRIDIGADEVMIAVTIQAELKITPQAISVASQGNYIQGHIRFSGEYDVRDIDTASVKLNGVLVPLQIMIDTECKEAIARFDRASVIRLLKGDEESTAFTINGFLTDGTMFIGTDTVKVVGNNKSQAQQAGKKAK